MDIVISIAFLLFWLFLLFYLFDLLKRMTEAQEDTALNLQKIASHLKELDLTKHGKGNKGEEP